MCPPLQQFTTKPTKEASRLLLKEPIKASFDFVPIKSHKFNKFFSPYRTELRIPNPRPFFPSLCHYSSMGKDHGNILAWMRKKWFLWFLKVGIMGLIMFANVTSEDQIGVPSTNTLCISDCATCPVICSPPPPLPPLEHSHPPPSPSAHHSQPPRPPPLEASAPKASSYSSVQPPPPPPYKYFNNMPPGSGTPPTTYPHDYSYPYYYFYASKASSLSLDASFFFTSLSLSFSVFLLVSKSRMQFVPWENI